MRLLLEKDEEYYILIQIDIVYSSIQHIYNTYNITQIYHKKKGTLAFEKHA